MAIADLQLRRRFGVTPMAVMRSGQHLHERIGQLPVRAGDVLLVCGDESSRERLRLDEDFSLLGRELQPLQLLGKAKIALVIAAAVVCLLSAQSIFRWERFPASSAALAGAMAMVVARCVSTQRAFAAIDWPILIFIAGTLALGEAMRATGVAALVAGAMVDVLAAWGVGAVASGMILLCFLFNFLVGHSAVAVLFTPIALAAAARLAMAGGFAPGSVEAEAIVRALLLAVCFGGSMCFATPIAHQVNLMVCGAGGYRYRDFLRMGLPVALLAWLLASAMIPLVTGV